MSTFGTDLVLNFGPLALLAATKEQNGLPRKLTQPVPEPVSNTNEQQASDHKNAAN